MKDGFAHGSLCLPHKYFRGDPLPDTLETNIVSDMPSGSMSGMYSDNLFDSLSGMYSDMLSVILPGI